MMTLNQIEVDGSSDCDQFVASVSICGVSIYKKTTMESPNIKARGLIVKEAGNSIETGHS